MPSCRSPERKAEVPNPLTDTTVKPGKVLLFDLEARFAKDVAARGGAAFADWFAGDGVSLGNGAAPKIGKVAIAKSATWSPKDYQLTWTPTDAMMGPSGDMGYTWGHYEGRSKDANGNPVLTTGRYITMWRREPDGNWKVVLDAGSNEPPASRRLLQAAHRETEIEHLRRVKPSGATALRSGSCQRVLHRAFANSSNSGVTTPTGTHGNIATESISPNIQVLEWHFVFHKIGRFV